MEIYSNMTVINIQKGRERLHELLEQACDRCKEGDFVASHFVDICMQELLDEWRKVPCNKKQI